VYRCVVGLLLVALSATGGRAADGFDWVTIGDVGNPAFEGGPGGQLKGRGSVDYAYRMTRTPITVGQWLEFLEAYAPYAGSEATSIALTGFFIFPVPDGAGGYTYVPGKGTEGIATDMSWRMAARFANWLHNDRKSTPEAFESGAYNVSTFTQNPDGTYNDQSTRSPGAKFWIPSLDEWIKAAHYDPALNGGKGGWWEQPNASNEPLIAGPPGVGQTNASLGPPLYPLEYMQVGQYPDVQSPWGLLDVSGGQWEWTEEWHSPFLSRRFKGSSIFSDELFYFEDHILWLVGSSPISNRGLRIASTVPAPSGVGILIGTFVMVFGRRRRC
jgi:formylglycine-generating enzyme required for sulfatase activity